MTLKPGDWLNHYEVLSHLGTGGMGEVYLARDTKLNRDVALKVLPEAFARDPERIGRFRREAQVLASLDHPNIARIYAFEETGSARFLVMELVLGETLRERIKAREQGIGNREQEGRGTGRRSGVVPIEEALEIAKQIAAGLEAAHEKAIVHRDLKPANVKVTPEGVVKVLDFGLAKAFAGDAASSDPSDSPTLSAMTQPGTILGTAAYMSPEQARGRKVDKRTDIWALGCVLYEMLAGKHAFDGEDVPEILASVMKGEPDWSALPPTTPPKVREILRRCLQKDAAKRFHSAADIALEMEEALKEPEAGTATASMAVYARVVAAQPMWRRAMPFVLTGLAVAIIAGIAAWTLKPASPQLVSRTVIPLPEGSQLGRTFGSNVALSPDGTRLAYIVASGQQQRQIFQRTMESGVSRPIAGTEGVLDHFFSPDGEWIGFSSFGSYKKVSVNGGATLTLSEAANPRGATWGPDDTIVFAPTQASGLSRVSAAGGESEPLTKPEDGETSHRWPQFLPDGNTVLFTITTSQNPDNHNIAALRLDSGERQILIRGGTYGRYVPTGHLVYYRSGTMLAVPFDPASLEVGEAPVPVMENVASAFGNTGGALFSFSNQGSFVYVQGGSNQGADTTLVWVDRQGRLEDLEIPPGIYRNPSLSPDGQRVAVSVDGTSTDVWTFDIPRGTFTRMTFEGRNDHPIWTPDGRRITYRSGAAGRGGPENLFWKLSDGSGAPERVTTSDHIQSPTSWSGDGRFLTFYERPVTGGAEGGRDVWVLPVEGDRKPRPFLQTSFDETAPVFAPNGKWIAYVSNESGGNNVFVQPYPGPGGKWQISTGGGIEPVWSRNGRELFYRVGIQMMAVEITTEPSFRAGTPRILFEGNFMAGAVARANYDVSPDGQRFLMVQPSGGDTNSTQIQVVTNWFEELKRRVPTTQ